MPRFARPFRPLALAAAALLLAAGCHDATAPTRELAIARARWQTNAPASYEFTYTITCFCLPDAVRPRIIRVAAGQVTSVRYADTGTPVPADIAAASSTIDGLFDEIARAVQHNAETVDVRYDSRYGYPVSAAIDGSAQVADDEYWFSVAGFHALP